MRDPERPDHFWVDPVGVAMHRVKVSDLVQVNHRGEVVRGNAMVNPVGLLLHTAVHRARPAVVAVCHAHAARIDPGRIRAPARTDHAGRLRVLRPADADPEPRVVRDPEAAARFAAGFGDKRVAIHGGHGIFTTGQSADEAAWWFVAMNRCCETQLLAQACGEASRWAEEDARWLASVLGSPQFGWLSFQPLWDEILRSDPDLVD